MFWSKWIERRRSATLNKKRFYWVVAEGLKESRRNRHEKWLPLWWQSIIKPWTSANPSHIYTTTKHFFLYFCRHFSARWGAAAAVARKLCCYSHECERSQVCKFFCTPPAQILISFPLQVGKKKLFLQNLFVLRQTANCFLEPDQTRFLHSFFCIFRLMIH